MYTKTLLFLSLAGAALAEPLPQADPTSDDFAALTSGSDAVPTFDSASYSSEMASLTSALNVYSDMPKLPPSIASILATAAPTDGSSLDPCATTEAAWVKNLPGSVKSAISSYDSALLSWYSAHSSELGPSYTGSITAGSCNGGAAATGTTAAPGSTNTQGSAASGTASPGSAARPTGAVAAGFAGVVGMVGLMIAL
jgi:hypothetical protein